jgi:4-nitrophenyl phosphatase
MTIRSLSKYRLFLLDIDGVLVRGGHVIPGAVEAIELLQQMGSTFFLTNNSTRSRVQVAERLSAIGFPIDANMIITSAYLAGRYLADKCGTVRVWPLGEEGLKAELVTTGHTIASPDRAQWIVAGMDRQLTYDKLAQALQALMNGASLLATNSDPTFPTPDGVEPGAGAVIGALSGMGYTPEAVVGKPASFGFEMALRMTGIAPEDALMVGDRLETDILGAAQAGIDSALVLTGVTSQEAGPLYEPQPQMVARSLHELASGQFSAPRE